jgi:hypothetical protein
LDKSMSTRAVKVGDHDAFLAREAKAIREIKERAEARAKALVADVVEIGKHLTRVKKRLGHGQFLPWLRDNFDWSDDTAERYMRVHRHVGKFRILRNLDLSALYALAGLPEAEIAEIAARVEAGGRPTAKQIRAATPKVTGYTTVARPAKVPVTVTHFTAKIPSVGYVTTEPAKPEMPIIFRRFLWSLAEIAAIEPLSPAEFVDAARAGQTPDGLTSGYLREVATMLTRFADELDSGHAKALPSPASNPMGAAAEDTLEEDTTTETAPDGTTRH